MLDGIYYNDIQFFRFYKDGTLLCAHIKVEGDMKKVATWFKKENTGGLFSTGSYKLVDKTIRFSTKAYLGDGRLIDYTGKIKSSKEILLDSLNHHTGRRTTNERFVKLVY